MDIIVTPTSPIPAFELASVWMTPGKCISLISTPLPPAWPEFPAFPSLAEKLRLRPTSRWACNFSPVISTKQGCCEWPTRSLRDDVMQERWAEEDAEARHEMDVEAIDAIPDEMRNTLEWPDRLCIVLETGSYVPAVVAPKYSAPVTDVIKMDWVLRFARAKEVYDAIFKEKIWTNSASQGRMRRS